MATTVDDVKEVAEAFEAKFTEFKAANDKRIEAIEAEKAKLVEKVDGYDEKLTSLEKLKKELEEELKKANRPDALKSTQVNEHKTAFMQFMRKGVDTGLGDLQAKALQTTVDADGGYAVPEEIDRTIIELLRDESPMRAVCGQITVGTPDYKKLVNLGGGGSGWVGETDPRPATGTPTLAQIAAYMGEIYANPQATQTSLDDIYFNAEAWISGEVAYEFAQQEGNAFLLGDGVKKPKGLMTTPLSTDNDKTRPFGTIQQLKSGIAGDFGADNLIDLVYATKAGYRKNGIFMLQGLTLSRIRKLKDSQGNYIWTPGLGVDQPSSILTYGYVENEDMPEVAAGSNALMFGDFKRAYIIVDRMGTRVLRDPYTNKPYVGFYTTKRVGGMTVDTQAVKVLTLEA